MTDKYIACMILHALGNCIGYKNNEWDKIKSKTSYDRTLTKIYEFINLGGITGIDLTGWTISDGAIMHMQTAKALLNYDTNDSMNTLGKLFVKYYLEAETLEEHDIKIVFGKSTHDALTRLKNGGVWDDMPYNFYSGGAGASIRCLCIGMAFSNDSNRHKLIQIAIESGRITNNSAVGYLGGLASALFAALAVEKVDINTWGTILLDLFNSGTIQKYIKMSGRGYEDFMHDYPIFVDKWYKYVTDKFENGKIIQRKSKINLTYRCKYYNENFGFKGEREVFDGPLLKMDGGKGYVRGFGNRSDDDDINKKGINDFNKINDGFIGSGGDDSVIIAYDCLIDAGDNFEKLIYYSMLHMGDTDTTGSIAAGLYGLIYGLEHIGGNLLGNFKYRDIMGDIGGRLWEKYKKN